ncbi:cache domain-containing protein [Magnetospirillum sp. UT-4]|uniref:cache domain-containing protein n=1 Tax=Magnetospirillum sp. UT-4 TaxID=2681467 RepID=UPI001381DC91|nr:cache domain-containing protein [Magnetospirillum sp. UT-4]CAA7611603.1 Methyl-accepting chemotaxis protein [Magnetospirillum sp. UT-4]
MNAVLRILILAVALWAGHPAAAAEPPNPGGVRALTLKAAALVEAQGLDAAREAFLADGEFKHGEIYVNVIDTNGTWLIYPPHPRNAGKSVLNVKDANGKLLVREIVATALDKGEGWVEYHWLNPATNRIQPKQTFVKHVPARGVIVYIGLYR